MSSWLEMTAVVESIDFQCYLTLGGVVVESTLCVFVCVCIGHEYTFTKVKLKYSCTIHGSGHISGGFVNLKIDFVKQILEKKKKQ